LELCVCGIALSICSAPAFFCEDTPQDPDFDATPQTIEPLPKSVTGVKTSRFEHAKTRGRRRKMTEKGKAHQLEIKFANRNSAFKRLKKQIERIIALHDSPETILEQLEEERFHLDQLKDEFNDAHKDFDDLLEFEEERNTSYQWFNIWDQEFIACRIRVCERIQALERKSSRTPSEKSSHSRKSQLSDRSKLSSSSTKHLSLALIDAAARSAKLHAEMEFLEKEKELRQLQLEKELAIANAEECAIKRILEEEKISAGDRKEIGSVKKELKSDLSHENIKRERSFSANQYAAPFVPRSHPTPHFEPLNSKPVPQFQHNNVNTAIQELVSLQAKQTKLSSLLINQQKISHLPVKDPPVFSGDYFEYPAFTTAFDSIISRNVPSDRDRLYFLDKYTKGKANEVVKGFLAMTSDSAYERARKLLDERFGNPIHVAKAYKSSLRS